MWEARRASTTSAIVVSVSQTIPAACARSREESPSPRTNIAEAMSGARIAAALFDPGHRRVANTNPAMLRNHVSTRCSDMRAITCHNRAREGAFEGNAKDAVKKVERECEEFAARVHHEYGLWSGRRTLPRKRQLKRPQSKAAAHPGETFANSDRFGDEPVSDPRLGDDVAR
jgi:hypothetical protein